MLDQKHREILLSLARESIENAMQHGVPLIPKEQAYPPELRQKLATFVTLKKQGQLRGCIGSLVATQSLMRDVAEHACSAAIGDRRFTPVNSAELNEILISISILSPAEPLSFTNEKDLIDQIVEGKDGLVLKSGFHKGTFLPSVWKSLPDKDSFLSQLKVKAGLPEDYWSNDIRVSRYRTEEFAESTVG